MVRQPPSGESADLKGQKKYSRFLPNRFLSETYKMVDDPALDHIISWNKEGSTIIVWRPAELASQVLPKSFEHNNFINFVRQLNCYGFRKIVPLRNVDRWEFFNESFRRGEKHLLGDIRRKPHRRTPAATTSVTASTTTYSAEDQVLSSNSPLGVEAPPAPPHQFLSINLTEENDHAKMNVLRDGMISNYSASQQAGKITSSVATSLELMPLVSDEAKTEKKRVVKLFGVVIGEESTQEFLRRP